MFFVELVAHLLVFNVLLSWSFQVVFSLLPGTSPEQLAILFVEKLTLSVSLLVHFSNLYPIALIVGSSRQFPLLLSVCPSTSLSILI